MKYIDIHGHISFPEYDGDREEVIRRATDASIGMITVGADLKSSKEAVALCEKYQNMWAVIGMHPIAEHGDKTPQLTPGFDYEEFRKLAINPKVVAIGECGLDYFHSKPEDITGQRKIFIQQIKLANEVDKPLMLHVRNSKTKGGGQIDVGSPSAYKDAVTILKDNAKVKANFHFFAGSMDDLKAVLDIGASVSFSGVITFARDYDELVKYVPLDRIMSETDCPFVAPAPYRGKRNEPSYVIEVIKAIAKIRGEDETVVSIQLLENARNFFHCF